MVNPQIEFTLIENDTPSLQLPAGNLRQRIVQMEGKNINQQLIEINEETTLGRIHGYISTPDYAKKGRAGQFFFANNRYIRHPYFHRAVMNAYEPLISPTENPNYFIYFEVAPESIDVNIHPTKTEVKFEDERTLWQILSVAIKESLGKYNAIPSIDFDTEGAPEIPVFESRKTPRIPKVNINPEYNPFRSSSSGETYQTSKPQFDWEKLYSGLETKPQNHGHELPPDTLFATHSEKAIAPETGLPEHYQYKQKYILTSVKSGLMIIDQHRAHLRILFDRYLDQIRRSKSASQRMLFPEMIELTAVEASALSEISEELEALGFEVSNMGQNTFAIQSIPAEIGNSDPVALIRSIIDKSIESGADVKSEIQEKIALSMAAMTAIPSGKTLSAEEMLLLVNQLFACQSSNFTPDGQTIIAVVADDELEKRFK